MQDLMLRSRCPGHAAQNLSEGGGFEHGESLSGWKSRGGQSIRYRDQLVRIGALVAAAADSGGDSIYRRRSVAVHNTGNVAEPVGGWRPRESVRRREQERRFGTQGFAHG